VTVDTAKPLSISRIPLLAKLKSPLGGSGRVFAVQELQRCNTPMDQGVSAKQ
jgi:hypothetical protein